MNKSILLIENQLPQRRIILEAARSKKLNIVLVKKNPSEVEQQLVDDVIVVDTDNYANMEAEVLSYANRHQIDGIVSYMEPNIRSTSQLAKVLNLPAMTPDAAKKATNKYLMRTCFAENKLPIPKFRLVSDLSDLMKACNDLGYPVVIKPTSCYASIGVIKIMAGDDLESIYNVVCQAVKDEGCPEQFIVEEYMPGSEVSVEAVVFDGQIEIVAITDKIVGDEPFFQEVGHIVPSALPPEVQNQVEDVTIKGIKALGIDFCATHTEVKITPEGPKIVEIAARLGGGSIPLLVRLAKGADISAAIYDIALGTPPKIRKRKNRYAGVTFFCPQKAGTITRIDGLDEMSQLDGVLLHHIDDCKDAYIDVPPKNFVPRLGWVIVVGDSHQFVYHQLQKASELVTIVVE